MSAKVICRLLGVVLMVLGACMLSCLPWALYYQEGPAGRALMVATAISIGAGGGLWLWGRGGRTTIYRREALAVVGLGWVLSGAFGALPYLIAGTCTSFVDAYFEAVSGFTTTGATVLANIEVVPQTILFWRMVTHWLGGMGIIVLFVAIFPQLGVGGKQLFRSEVPGPISEGLRPKIKETALALWKIYALLTVLACLLLMLCGMSFFDALCHAFATLATGGYSTKNASIAHYDSAAVDLVISLFMFLAGVNFSLYYLFFRGRYQALLRDGELRLYLALTLVVSLVIAADISDRHGGLLAALRYASFQTLSIITTTGFTTDDFNAYPALSKTLLVCLMFVGGCAGSTAGGLKVSRVLVVFKVAYQEVYSVFRPQVHMSVKIGRTVVGEEVVRSILIFVLSFVALFALGSIFMAGLGLDLVTASTSVVACLANVGPGLARVGALENYAHIPVSGKAFLSFCMLLGRLELGTLLVLFVADFWRR